VYAENLEIVNANLEKPNIKRRKISIELALVRSERDNSLNLLWEQQQLFQELHDKLKAMLDGNTEQDHLMIEIL